MTQFYGEKRDVCYLQLSKVVCVRSSSRRTVRENDDSVLDAAVLVECRRVTTVRCVGREERTVKCFSVLETVEQ